MMTTKNRNMRLRSQHSTALLVLALITTMLSKSVCGQCDLIYLRNPNYKGGLGMEIHVRTFEHHNAKQPDAYIKQENANAYQYIHNVAIRIGRDILEVQGESQSQIIEITRDDYDDDEEKVEDGASSTTLSSVTTTPWTYWINGKEQVVLPAAISEHAVTKLDENTLEIDLSDSDTEDGSRSSEAIVNSKDPAGMPDEMISIQRRKLQQQPQQPQQDRKEAIRIVVDGEKLHIDFKNLSKPHFYGSLGMIGSFDMDYQKVGRVQNRIIDDVDEFTQEWTVRYLGGGSPRDPVLFHAASPQHPQICEQLWFLPLRLH